MFKIIHCQFCNCLIRAFYLICLLLFSFDLNALQISSEQAISLSERVWKNECGGKLEHLTCWNEGEEFASLGIGHFIWYPEGAKENFKQTFPALLLFIQKQKIPLPEWLKTSKGSPWKNRTEFYRDFASSRMRELRQFLYDTRKIQALFMAQQLEIALTNILTTIPPNQHKNIHDVFNKIAKESNGVYALLDYLNFKGEGTSLKERYNGQGWGLLQVLQKINPSSSTPLKDFVQAAKDLLTTRVENAPPERNEKRWLKGWLNRLDSY